MSISTHYYVLSLSEKTNSLFEAFRDTLIEVENQGFPVVDPAPPSGPIEPDRRRELAQTVDRCFAHYYTEEPLKLVVVGTAQMQSAFYTVTAHGSAVIGRIEGDHGTTDPRDLGQIVWPVVREAMSGLCDRAMDDLDDLAERGPVASGLEAVVRVASQSMRSTLLVEDDYHQRGSLGGTDRPPTLSPNVDIRDANDDVVDAVIERVLESGGNVVFLPPGALQDRDRIVLLPRDGEGP